MTTETETNAVRDEHLARALLTIAETTAEPAPTPAPVAGGEATS